MVGVDERAAQAVGRPRHLAPPDLARALEPAAGAVENLKQRRREKRQGERPAATALATGNARGEQPGRCGREQEGRAARGGGRQRQREIRLPPAGENLARPVGEGEMSGREASRERARDGQGLQQAEEGNRGERSGRPGQQAQRARRLGAREREREDEEGRDLEGRRGPGRDAREGQRRPEQ